MTATTESDRVAVAVRERSPAELVVLGPEPVRAWRETQRVEVPGAKHTPAFKRGNWDGTVAPGRCRRVGNAGAWELTLSRGLLHRLQSSFALPTISTGGAQDTLIMSAAVDALRAENLRGRELRDYQKEAVLRSLAHGWGRIALATNAGKGAVIGLIARTLHRTRGLKTLILADEIAVFEALKEEIESWAELRPALVKSGAASDPPSDPIVVAMVPTLHRRIQGEAGAAWKDWVGSFSCVLLDEADKASAATWQAILRQARNSTWRVGFSGTFLGDDPFGELVMDELMGPVLVRAKNIELVERGISARPKVQLVGFNCAPELVHTPVRAMLWRDMSPPERRLSIYDRAIVHNHDRHLFILGLIRPDAPTAIIVNRIEHGEELEQVIPGAEFLDGSSSEMERDQTLRRFKAGEVRVLIATRIFDRGTNRLGHATDLIFASGEGSTRQTLQRIGRGLRRTDGKASLRLVDVVDRGHKYLHTGATKRIKLYAEEEFDVEVVP